MFFKGIFTAAAPCVSIIKSTRWKIQKLAALFGPKFKIIFLHNKIIPANVAKYWFQTFLNSKLFSCFSLTVIVIRNNALKLLSSNWLKIVVLSDVTQFKFYIWKMIGCRSFYILSREEILDGGDFNNWLVLMTNLHLNFYSISKLFRS